MTRRSYNVAALLAVAFLLTALLVSSVLAALAAERALQPSARVEVDAVRVAQSYIGTTETRGPNRSPIIDAWNKAVGAPLGSPYCASAVSAWLDSVAMESPRQRTAWSRAFRHGRHAFPAREVTTGRRRVVRGDVVLWRRGSGGGHIGIASEDWQRARGRVTEANTSAPRTAGSQWDGDGVYDKPRAINALSAFRVDYIVPTSQSMARRDSLRRGLL